MHVVACSYFSVHVMYVGQIKGEIETFDVEVTISCSVYDTSDAEERNVCSVGCVNMIEKCYCRRYGIMHMHLLTVDRKHFSFLF